jgi:hypothetical protein
MSGPICPDCGLLALEQVDPTKMLCPICGWEGENPPRKILTSLIGSELHEETQKQLTLRQEGRLTYFRVYLRGSDDQKGDATFDIMELLDLTHKSGSDRLIFHIEGKPSFEQMDAIKHLEAVKKVEIY